MKAIVFVCFVIFSAALGASKVNEPSAQSGYSSEPKKEREAGSFSLEGSLSDGGLLSSIIDTAVGGIGKLTSYLPIGGGNKGEHGGSVGGHLNIHSEHGNHEHGYRPVDGYESSGSSGSSGSKYNAAEKFEKIKDAGAQILEQGIKTAQHVIPEIAEEGQAMIQTGLKTAKEMLPALNKTASSFISGLKRPSYGQKTEQSYGQPPSYGTSESSYVSSTESQSYGVTEGGYQSGSNGGSGSGWQIPEFGYGGNEWGV